MRISNTYTQGRQTGLKIASAQIWGGANLRPEFSRNFQDRTLLFLLGKVWAQSSPCDGREKIGSARALGALPGLAPLHLPDFCRPLLSTYMIENVLTMVFSPAAAAVCEQHCQFIRQKSDHIDSSAQCRRRQWKEICEI